MTKSQRIFIAKFVFGLGLLALLLLQDGVLDDTLDVLSKIDATGAIVVALFPTLLIGASCLKWQLLLDYRGQHLGLAALMRFYTVGYFFNNFLPSSLGGDAARSYMVGKRIRSQTESLAAVFLERLSGLVTLVILAFIGFLATPAIRDDILVTGPLALLGLGCVVLMIAVWAPLPHAQTGMGKLATLPLLGKIVSKLGQMRDAMQDFWARPRVVGLTLLYSLLYHALTVVNVWVTARILGLDLDFVALCAVTPIILVIASVPTTPGSIGVWEWAHSVLLIPLGAEMQEGLAIALLLRAQLLSTSVVGAALYLSERHSEKPQDMEKSDG